MSHNKAGFDSIVEFFGVDISVGKRVKNHLPAALRFLMIGTFLYGPLDDLCEIILPADRSIST